MLYEEMYWYEWPCIENTVIGLGRRVDGVVREDHFVITVASEIMAILCLANDMADLKNV